MTASFKFHSTVSQAFLYKCVVSKPKLRWPSWKRSGYILDLTKLPSRDPQQTFHSCSQRLGSSPISKCCTYCTSITILLQKSTQTPGNSVVRNKFTRTQESQRKFFEPFQLVFEASLFCAVMNRVRNWILPNKEQRQSVDSFISTVYSEVAE